MFLEEFAQLEEMDLTIDNPQMKAYELLYNSPLKNADIFKLSSVSVAKIYSLRHVPEGQDPFAHTSWSTIVRIARGYDEFCSIIKSYAKKVNRSKRQKNSKKK